jgi:hypothetical protein
MREIEPTTSWIALAVCILTPKTIEQAFNDLVVDPRISPRKQQKSTDTIDMVKLREKGLTYQAIGQIFGLKHDTVFKRIKRFKQKQGQGERRESRQRYA